MIDHPAMPDMTWWTRAEKEAGRIAIRKMVKWLEKNNQIPPEDLGGTLVLRPSEWLSLRKAAKEEK